MDIYERIVLDHDTQRELAAALEATSGDSEERRELWDRFKPEAEAHAAAEEQTFYAELIADPETQEQARHSVSEHKEAADLLEELGELDMSSSQWLAKFKTLKDDLEHHMSEEENEVFAQARRVISQQQATKLVDEFEARKSAEL